MRPSWDPQKRHLAYRQRRLYTHTNTREKEAWHRFMRLLLPTYSVQQAGTFFMKLNKQRGESQMYPTFRDEVLLLVRALARAPDRVVDVCKGSGGICRVLEEVWPATSVVTMDIAAKWEPTTVCDFLNPSTYSQLPKRLARAAIFSPPFELADVFLANALARVSDFVAMHVPVDFPEGRSPQLSAFLSAYATEVVSLASLPNYRGRIGKCHWLVVYKTKHIFNRYSASAN